MLAAGRILLYTLRPSECTVGFPLVLQGTGWGLGLRAERGEVSFPLFEGAERLPVHLLSSLLFVKNLLSDSEQQLPPSGRGLWVPLYLLNHCLLGQCVHRFSLKDWIKAVMSQHGFESLFPLKVPGPPLCLRWLCWMVDFSHRLCKLLRLFYLYIKNKTEQKTPPIICTHIKQFKQHNTSLRGINGKVISLP